MSPTLLIGLFVHLLEPLDAARTNQTAITLGFTAYSSDVSAIGIGDEASGTRVDAIWIATQEARLRASSGCKSDSSRSLVAGPSTAELVKHVGAVTPSSRIEAGQYCGFELQLRRSGGRLSEAPSELHGASIVVEGHRADGLRFVVRSRITPALLLRAGSLEGLQVSGSSLNWIVGIDVARWFSGLDLALAEPSHHGRDREVRVDEKSNRELLMTFQSNVEAGFALFDDPDGDHLLDTEERSHPIATRR